MQAGQPRVSIGLFVRNGENYLRAALDSLLAQTYTAFELIVSDNASTDATAEICRSYAARDSRIRYLRNAVDLGAAPNANRVFEPAAGEYFKWATHDDVCAPTFLERCVGVLDRFPAVVLCYARTLFVDEQGRPLEYYHGDSLHLRFATPYERYHAYHQRFRRRGNCNPIFGVMRAGVLRETPRFGSYPSSDMILLGELALRGEIHEVQEYLYQRRDHPLRSVRLHARLEERAQWFDTSQRPSVQLPRWRWFGEYLRAVTRVPMSPADKLRCYLETGGWLVRHRRGLLGDLTGVAHQLISKHATTA
jgi:glycosyltransferase involved in cell wall biosynthesis